jgi:hypothetical protein
VTLAYMAAGVEAGQVSPELLALETSVANLGSNLVRMARRLRPAGLPHSEGGTYHLFPNCAVCASDPQLPTRHTPDGPSHFPAGAVSLSAWDG